jgi:hypothetical protein
LVELLVLYEEPGRRSRFRATEEREARTRTRSLLTLELDAAEHNLSEKVCFSVFHRAVIIGACGQRGLPRSEGRVS